MLSIFVVHPSALLTDHLPHGDGLVAFGFLRELAARGHELHVAAQRVDLRDPLPDGLHVHEIAPHRVGGPVARLDFMRRMRRTLGTLGGAERFDLAHQLNPVDVGLSLALAGVPLPLVLGPYVPDWPAPDARRATRSPVPAVKRVLRAAQQRRATTVLLSTPAAASKLEVSRRRVHVHEVAPGIDPAAWDAGDVGGADGQDVLFLANLHERKGILVLLEAFDIVASELPAARLLVGGDGPLAAEVRRRVAASSAGDRVELLGHVGREQVAATMRRCAVYCLPSFGEPFGMTALEAMACGRAVVATDAGGLRHLVDEHGGRRVAPGDAEALAGALRELLADRALRRAMGAHNRRSVEERFAWSRSVDRLERAYAEAVTGRRDASSRRRRRSSS